MGLWQFISVVYGYFTPPIIEFVSKKVEGVWKVILVVFFCLISGVIAGILENGLNYNWTDIGDIFGFAAVIFVASQVAWNNTWKKVFDKIEESKELEEWNN